MKKIIVSIILGAVTTTTHAGLKATTVHSRANCINNESITWWLNHSYIWKVVSIHDNGYGFHVVDTGFKYTWRQAAVHWGEGPLCRSDWEVSGYHYIDTYANGKIPFDQTFADDCGIYNGWWDH